MKLTKKSETSSKITFTYDKPTAETEGYIYYANDVAVSRTFNPDDLEVTFGKVASGRYAVDAIGFEELDRAEWPEVTVPPPSGDGLAWRPPGLTAGADPLNPASFPGFQVVDIRQPGTYPSNPSSTTDYLFRIDVTATTGRVVLHGGRHRVVIGGRSKIVGGGDPCAIMVEEGNPSGVTHVEGMYLESTNGICLRTNQVVQLCAIHARVAPAADHADLCQVWKGQKCPEIRVDRFTGHSDFTFFSDFTDEPGSTFGAETPVWNLHRVDLHGPRALNNWMGSPAHCVWKGDDLWLETSTTGDGQRRDLGDQLRQHGEQYSPKFAGYQILDAGGQVLYTQPENVASGAPGEIGRTAGHWLRYHLNPRLTATWRFGVPPGGEFVPAAKAGAGYVPLGYR